MGASEIPASQADRLFSFVATRTDPWVLKSRLETRLNDMRFSIEALRGPVARAFPSYAAAELDRRVVPIFVSVDGDQLFGLDLKDAFRSVESVSLTDSKGEARTSIVVKQLGLVVASVPPETQTIRYAQYEVNLLLGALLMPNNATYQYELMTGGAEIEYAFEVTVTSSTGSTEFLLRDRQREQWSHCSGARVVNVFGGAEPVTWNANADMTRRCGSSSPQISLSDIRKALAAKIAVDIATRLVERQSTTSVASSP